MERHLQCFCMIMMISIFLHFTDCFTLMWCSTSFSKWKRRKLTSHTGVTAMNNTSYITDTSKAILVASFWLRLILFLSFLCLPLYKNSPQIISGLSCFCLSWIRHSLDKKEQQNTVVLLINNYLLSSAALLYLDDKVLCMFLCFTSKLCS